MKKTIILLFMISIFGLVGCSKEPINDNVSVQKPNIFIEELEPHMFVFHEVYTDAMQRDGEFPRKVVVDSEYYVDNDIARGDIVFVDIPENVADEVAHGNQGQSITRVVGLPGETLEIKDGQVYINNQPLDTFYGHEYKWKGLPAEKITVTSRESQIIPDDHLFLIGDNWWRSPIQGPISKEYIIGKVIGYPSE